MRIQLFFLASSWGYPQLSTGHDVRESSRVRVGTSVKSKSCSGFVLLINLCSLDPILESFCVLQRRALRNQRQTVGGSRSLSPTSLEANTGGRSTLRTNLRGTGECPPTAQPCRAQPMSMVLRERESVPSLSVVRKPVTQP